MLDEFLRAELSNPLRMSARYTSMQLVPGPNGPNDYESVLAALESPKFIKFPWILGWIWWIFDDFWWILMDFDEFWWFLMDCRGFWVVYHYPRRMWRSQRNLASASTRWRWIFQPWHCRDWPRRTGKNQWSSDSREEIHRIYMNLCHLCGGIMWNPTRFEVKMVKSGN